MAIPESYDSLASRLYVNRSWAGSVVQGNRCAMVVGATLGIKPKSGDFSFADLKADPRLKDYFVRATDLALRVLESWGAPDIKGRGIDAVKQIDGTPGVIYLEDCWRTPREKVNGLLFGVDLESGDHMDLWNGRHLEIYPKRNDSISLISRSDKVWLWKARSMDIVRTV